MGSMAAATEVHMNLLSARKGFGLQRKPPPVHLQNKLKFPNISSNAIMIIRCSSSSGAIANSSSYGKALEAEAIRKQCRKWVWKGQYSINYLVSSDDLQSSLQSSLPPLLLVHGFGASIPHWRRNIATLAQNYTVYAIDLLGFGASDKPKGFSYTMEGWAQLILDFLEEVVQKPTVLIGNSVGSLACVIAASESSPNFVRGLVLLNCAGGMNNKAIVDDWRIKLLLPVLLLVDFLLKQRAIASAIFERVKQRYHVEIIPPFSVELLVHNYSPIALSNECEYCFLSYCVTCRDTLRNILLSVYGNKESVDEELVEIIRGPANDDGALDAFVSIVTGPPGPNPVKLMPRISIPVLVLWGDQDPFTPLDGPVGDN